MSIRAPSALACGALLLLFACQGESPTEVVLAKTGAGAPLRVTPSALSFFSPAVAPATITVSVQFVGIITATSSDASCATVSPGSVPAGKPKGSSVYVATFTVTPVGPGSCVVTVADKQQRTAQTTIVVRMPTISGKLVYQHLDNFDEPTHVRSMNPIGADPVDLTPNAYFAGAPVLSPDGSEIAFVLAAPFSTADLYRMRTDGSGQTLVLDGSVGLSEPEWSPDGLRLTFVTHIFCCAGDIGTVNIDGSQNTLLNSGEFSGYPHWLPDGTHIAYTSFDDQARVYVVFTMGADGSNPIRFAEDASSPQWSPDGTRIVFVSRRDGGDSEIYVMNADATGQTRLTDSPGVDRAPTWSPDGTMIAFESERTGDRDIYLMHADGTGVINLTNSPGQDTEPSWR
jgi:dipeptidyl aminopeptidase/acylaminoacyl peptidase